MKEKLFFVKFGERKNLQQLIDGKIYFSNASKFINLEKEQLKKGQGDINEGRFKIQAIKVEMRHPDTKELISVHENVMVNLGFEGIETMPIFCITAGNYTDCEYFISETHYKIKFSPQREAIIRSQFNKADSALIIKTPEIFIRDVKNLFNNNCHSDFVQYFDMSIMTTDRIMFLFDVPVFSTSNTKVRTSFITGDNVHKHLYCKDLFFKEQQEFRFVPSLIKISEPKLFDVGFNSCVELCDLDSFFNGVEIKI